MEQGHGVSWTLPIFGNEFGINETERWILEAIALAEDKGISEPGMEKMAQTYSSDVFPYVSEVLDVFEQLLWITAKWEVLTGEAKATKIRRCIITELGRKALGKAV
jgi:hypothetical protein